MVASESELMAQAEVDSPAMTNSIDRHHSHKNSHMDRNHNHGNGNAEHNNSINNSNYVVPNLGRQSSIYSLTLDEFQHTLSENGKNFGSMNMDEFLNSIWTAEETQAHHNHHHHENNNTNIQLPSVSVAASSTSRGPIAKQPSLPRQGSLTLPAPLCRKTVDEVWTEIQRRQPGDEQPEPEQLQPVGNSGGTQRQPTFGEMTLEDFLIKAGVVREQCGSLPPTPLAAVPPPPPSAHPPHHQYGFSTPQMGPTFVTRPMMGMPPGGAYQPMPPNGGESSGYSGNGKRSNGYPSSVVGPSVTCYGSRMNNGGAPSGGYAPGAGAGLSPVSPVSPEGICGPGQVDNTGGQFGLDMASLRGRKRIIDGPVEKVVERRQRRMIKNRESAARSRARKQAYTVELEAELNQLREENAQLKQALEEIERQRKQQYHEEQNIQVVLSRAQRAQDKLRAMRRSRSCTL